MKARGRLVLAAFALATACASAAPCEWQRDEAWTPPDVSAERGPCVAIIAQPGTGFAYENERAPDACAHMPRCGVVTVASFPALRLWRRSDATAYEGEPYLVPGSIGCDVLTCGQLSAWAVGAGPVEGEAVR